MAYDDSDSSPGPSKGKGKDKGKTKGKAKEDNYAEPAPQQAQGKKQKQQKGGKGGESGRSQQSAPASSGSSSLPAPWVAVPDPNSGRMYYWNQSTNEVSWTPPTGGRGQPSSP